MSPCQLIVRLYNGAHTKEAWNPDGKEFVDDIRPLARAIECDGVNLAHGWQMRLYRNGIGCFKSIDIDAGGFLLHDSAYYGDFEVYANPDAIIAAQKGSDE